MIGGAEQRHSELRSEKPWRSDEGPGFNSRHLHPDKPLVTSVTSGFCHELLVRHVLPALLRRTQWGSDDNATTE